ncbi:MAG: trigger factor [Gammaproteobacteria bacterium]|nr:trigger factor [Gammaproteobacteria bacterium]MDH5304563.1 trigger factor [Gammaproteobacteria bacterium]MDH5322569.1 trigger factor [Gammaproteobacteria bacterium]
MQVSVESTGKLERRMRVELPAARIDQEINSRLKSVGKTAKIKGFRPGKVPAQVVKKRYGQQIREEVLSEIMRKSYSEAVRRENLHPAGGPNIEPQTTSDGKSFAYIATFEVMPEVELQKLDQISVTKPEVTIGKNDLDSMLEKLQRQKATWKEVARASSKGDRVIVDFDGTIKGEPIAGGKGREIPVVLGEGQMLEDFEKALFGVTAGEEKSFKVKFPKDYQAQELQGKKVDFVVVTHRVEEQVLPPVDDAFAAMFEVTEGGIDKFIEDVKENMQREADARVSQDTREQVIAALLKTNHIDIPKTLKHEEMHVLQREAMQRLGVEDVAKAPALDNFAEVAEKRVRLGLLIRKLIADQKLSVNSAMVRARVEQMCAGYENSEDMVNMYMSNPQIVEQIEPMVLEQQAIDWLMANGKVTIKKIAFNDYMKS